MFLGIAQPLIYNRKGQHVPDNLEALLSECHFKDVSLILEFAVVAPKNDSVDDQVITMYFRKQRRVLFMYDKRNFKRELFSPRRGAQELRDVLLNANNFGLKSGKEPHNDLFWSETLCDYLT